MPSAGLLFLSGVQGGKEQGDGSSTRSRGGSGGVYRVSFWLAPIRQRRGSGCRDMTAVIRRAGGTCLLRVGGSSSATSIQVPGHGSTNLVHWHWRSLLESMEGGIHCAHGHMMFAHM